MAHRLEYHSTLGLRVIKKKKNPLTPESGTLTTSGGNPAPQRVIDNLLVRIHFIIVMIRWTGLAPGEFEFPFPGSLTSTFPAPHGVCVRLLSVVWRRYLCRPRLHGLFVS